MAARLPPKYIGAVVLGSNISGTMAALASTATTFLAPSPKTSAVYYFIIALLVLLACFDTYFALPLNVSYLLYTNICLNHPIVFPLHLGLSIEI